MAIPAQQVDPQMLAQSQEVAQRQMADALAAQKRATVAVKTKETRVLACRLVCAAIFGVLAAILLSLSGEGGMRQQRGAGRQREHLAGLPRNPKLVRGQLG